MIGVNITFDGNYKILTISWRFGVRNEPAIFFLIRTTDEKPKNPKENKTS